MKKLLIIFFAFASISPVFATSPPTPNMVMNDMDYKNVMAKVNNLVIMRSFESSYFSTDVNIRNSYLEAYDLYTGRLVWCHKGTGIIVSYIVVNDELIIYRNYQSITAIDARDGSVVWSKKTIGEYSTIVGE